MKLYVTLNVSTFNFAFLVAHPFPDARLSVALLDLLYHITLFSFQGAEKEYALMSVPSKLNNVWKIVRSDLRDSAKFWRPSLTTLRRSP